MDAGLLEFFGPQERRLEVAGRKLVVRTLPDDANTAELTGADVMWRLVVRCTFYAEDYEEHKAGERVFSDDDVPTLAAAPALRTVPLARAVEAVNALDLWDTIKNSGAGPSAG